MCGRYTLRARLNTALMELEAENRIEGEWRERYNIAPTQQVAIVRPDVDTGKRELVALRWGLVPFWADDVKIGYTMINARSETLLEKKSFSGPLKKRRCIVLADGFFEWKKLGTKTKGKEDKLAHFIHMKDDRVFAFAGLWESNKKATGEPIETCTIITTSPNELMSDLHDRMPAILSESGIDAWLDPKNDKPELLLPLLAPYPDAEMEAYPVSSFVNNVKNQGSECVERV
jgi:putative SOS response-associated peptidase YedK